MKTRLLTVAALVVALCSQFEAAAQTRTRNTTPAVPTLMSSLPESDAVAQVKMQQLLNEAMPRIFAGNPAKLSEVNASIDRFKDRTGLDPRMFQQSVGRRDESADRRTREWNVQRRGNGRGRSSRFEWQVS